VTHPADLDLVEAAAALRGRELSAVELLDACLERIAARNGGEPTFDGAPGAVNAWVRLYPELAREQARAADERLAGDEHAGGDEPAGGSPGTLCGSRSPSRTLRRRRAPADGIEPGARRQRG
jgi:hypothetical protein